MSLNIDKQIELYQLILNVLKVIKREEMQVYNYLDDNKAIYIYKDVKPKGKPIHKFKYCNKQNMSTLWVYEDDECYYMIEADEFKGSTKYKKECGKEKIGIIEKWNKHKCKTMSIIDLKRLYHKEESRFNCIEESWTHYSSFIFDKMVRLIYTGDIEGELNSFIVASPITKYI